jgi:DMSO/TMAO reductase YedYZ molybdopterin-dependent catalytic subunit
VEEVVIGYYLGDAVEVVDDYGDGWVAARFVDDRKGKVWRMWSDQIKATPWGDEKAHS